jgi:hypothetical protein
MEKGNSTFDFEVDSQDQHLQSKTRALRLVDSVRIGATALALLMGLTVLGVSANTLSVYDSTHVSSDFLLALWPDEFNIRPTVALVVGSAFVIATNIVALCFSKIPSVSHRHNRHAGSSSSSSRATIPTRQWLTPLSPQLRNKTTVHTSLTFAAPLVGLAAALIAIIFFYTVNASDSVDTFLSWTCRWTSVPMTQQPHWNTLCSQSRAGLYLSILLIPVEAVALGLAGYQLKVEKYTNAYENARKGSPTLS